MMNVRARSNAAMRSGVTMARFFSSGFRSINSVPCQDPSAGSFRSFLECVVYDLFQGHLKVHAPRWRIFHYDEEHVLGAVDHEIDAGGAIPFDLPERARRRRHRIAGIG